jgi:TRAP-type C4-dicarboxylate transport system permease small subunit
VALLAKGAKAVDAWIQRVLEVALVLTLAACVAAALTAAISRYLPELPIYMAWPDEMARGMMAWMTFLGAAILIRDNEHIRLEVPPGWFGGARGTIVRSMIADFLLVGGLVVVVWSAYAVTASDASVTLTTMQAPLALISGSILVGTLCQFYFGLRQLIRDLRNMRTRWQTPA